jgi:hypothetical protein
MTRSGSRRLELSSPECPLMAQSRHEDDATRCLLFGLKRTQLGDFPMSPNDPSRKSATPKDIFISTCGDGISSVS